MAHKLFVNTFFQLSRTPVIRTRRYFNTQPRIATKITYNNQFRKDVLLKAENFLQNGQFKDAIKFCDQYLDKNPNAVKLHLTKAVALSNLEKHQEALEICNKAIQIDPKEFGTVGYLVLGNAHVGLGQFTEGAEVFDQGLELDPKNIPLLFNKGVCKEKLDRLDGAIDCFIKVLDIDSNHIMSYVNITSALLRKKQGFEALRYIEKALTIEPENVQLLLNKGTAYVILHQYENSLMPYEHVTEIENIRIEKLPEKSKEDYENLFTAHMGKAAAFTYLQRYNESMHHYDKVLKKNPTHLKALLSKSYTLFQLMGQPHEALDTIEIALREHPDNKFANTLKHAINHAIDAKNAPVNESMNPTYRPSR